MRLAIFRVMCVVLSMVLTVHFGVAHAAIKGPGWHNTVAEPIEPSRARAYYQSQQANNAGSRTAARTSVSSPSLIAEPQSASVSPFSDDIQNLARALRHDPLRIYEFVRNNIDYAPYFGYLKGPGLTLLERSGNDFDQAALMIELLRASGYSASFVYGQMTIPNFFAVNQRDMQHWLGVDVNAEWLNRC